MKAHLPDWTHAWLPEIALGLQVLAIVLGAFVLRWLVRLALHRLNRRYDLPIEVVVGARRISAAAASGIHRTIQTMSPPISSHLAA